MQQLTDSKMQYIHQVPNELLVSNQDLVTFLSFGYYTFALKFPEISDQIVDIETQNMLPLDKASFVIQKLVQSTTYIRLEVFICKLKETLEYFQHNSKTSNSTVFIDTTLENYFFDLLSVS